MQTVQLFLDNTPSVVNIANIGAVSRAWPAGVTPLRISCSGLHGLEAMMQ